MKRQVEMEKSMETAHRVFMSNLEKSLDLLEEELKEASELSDICTDEWCRTAEDLVDDLHKEVYGISEPRWLSEEDSCQLKLLRMRVRDLYAKYKSIKEH